MDSSRVQLNPDTRGLEDAAAKSQGKLALAVGVIAIALSLVLGFVYLISFRRLEGELARLSQQTEGLNRMVERVQKQSQTSAQQASEAAANARAAAQQRDSANQAQLNSEAQAQVARAQAATEQQKADQATQLPGGSDQASAANRRVEIAIVESKVITNGPLSAPQQLRR